jgi:hypothetical protein
MLVWLAFRRTRFAKIPNSNSIWFTQEAWRGVK